MTWIYKNVMVYPVEGHLGCSSFSYKLMKLVASLLAQTVKTLPTIQETWVGKISLRREWQPNPVFLPGEVHGQRSLSRAGYSPWVYGHS